MKAGFVICFVHFCVSIVKNDALCLLDRKIGRFWADMIGLHFLKVPLHWKWIFVVKWKQWHHLEATAAFQARADHDLVQGDSGRYDKKLSDYGYILKIKRRIFQHTKCRM